MTPEITFIPEQELLICQTETTTLKYRVFQIYGQRIIKSMDQNRIPSSVAEVFASNIPRNISVENMFRFFAQSGEIYQMRLLMDFSGCNRGRCFVQYQEIIASRQAICCLHDEVIENEHRVGIKFSLNNTQLILKSIPAWITQEQIEHIVRGLIGEGLLNVSLRPSRLPFKNYCFCTYSDHRFAIMAHKKAWPFITIFGHAVDVHWAVPELLRYGVNLYFTSFPMDMTKEEFFNILVGVIEIESLVQFRITNGFGFMTFVNIMYLNNAERALSNLTIRGFRLRLSRLPFAENGVDRLTCQYYQSRTVQFPLTVPPRVVHPYSVPFQFPSAATFPMNQPQYPNTGPCQFAHSQGPPPPAYGPYVCVPGHSKAAPVPQNPQGCRAPGKK